MSLTVDLQRWCETCEEGAVEGVENREEVSEPMDEVGKSVRCGEGVERMDSRPKSEVGGDAKGGVVLREGE